MDIESESNKVPTFDPSVTALKPIVKVFIIENAEGNWLDCGAGTLQLVIKSGGQIKGLQVVTNLLEAETRDYISGARAKRLRGGSEDNSIILDISFESTNEFAKCQSTIISWEQTDLQESIALSFLDPWDCREYWKALCALQKIPYQEELYDLTKDNILKITIKLEDDPDLRPAYVSALVSNVASLNAATKPQKLPRNLQNLRRKRKY